MLYSEKLTAQSIMAKEIKEMSNSKFADLYFQLGLLYATENAKRGLNKAIVYIPAFCFEQCSRMFLKEGFKLEQIPHSSQFVISWN